MEKAKTFREEYDCKSRTRALNEYSWFGIAWGIVLALTGAYWAVCTQGVANVMFKAVSLIGFLLLVVGVVAPLVLRKPAEFIRKAFSCVGNIILKLILLPVYLVMTVINAFTNKKYSEKFGFRNWEERHCSGTAFCDFNHTGENKYKHTAIGTVIKVLSFFVNNKMFVVVPVIMILLILGAIMFFASSSAVFSFVYTLF